MLFTSNAAQSHAISVPPAESNSRTETAPARNTVGM